LGFLGWLYLQLLYCIPAYLSAANSILVFLAFAGCLPSSQLPTGWAQEKSAVSRARNAFQLVNADAEAMLPVCLPSFASSAGPCLLAAPRD
jgi:pyruvoyl-dependent arginine decarboxylase (PvlArgDC)